MKEEKIMAMTKERKAEIIKEFQKDKKSSDKENL